MTGNVPVSLSNIWVTFKKDNRDTKTLEQGIMSPIYNDDKYNSENYKGVTISGVSRKYLY